MPGINSRARRNSFRHQPSPRRFRPLRLEMCEDRRLLAADLQTLGGNEPAVAVHPTDPNIVAVAQFRSVWISRDGGATFPAAQQVNIPLQAGYAGGGGDPSMAFDSQGRLYFSYLASQQTPANANFFLALFAARIDNVATGTPTVAQNQLVAPETNANHHDKEWIAVDSNPASPFRDQAYIVWSQLGGAQQIMFSRSVNGGANWSAASPISGAAVAGGNAGAGFMWPSHAAVATNGDLYVGWHNNTCNGAATNMTILRDSTGGANLANADGGALNLVQSSSFQSAVTCNVQDASGDEVPLVNAWMQGALQPFILPDPVRPGNVYVVANDDPNNSFGNGDDGDIILARSTDNGNNWNISTISHAPAGTLQAFPTAGIDELGNIAVSWYDTRRGLIGPGEDGILNQPAPNDNTFLLDVYHTVSRDGGLSFSNDFRINDQAFDPTVAAPCRFGPQAACGTVTPGTGRTLRIGEYNGLASSDGMVYSTWMDIRGGAQVIMLDKFSMLGAFADAAEGNDSRATATILGSLPKITVQDQTLHDTTDVDFYQYTAAETGKLVLNLFFDHAGPGVNAGTANLTLTVRDTSGDVVATGTQAVILPSLAREQIVIPVVSQQRYYIEVNSTVDAVENPVVYDLEIENFAAPVPIAVDLDPISDSGRDDTDDNTFTAPAHVRILADVRNFVGTNIAVLTPAQATAGLTAGAAVQLFLNGTAVGYASAVPGSDNTLFEANLAGGDLDNGFPIFPPGLAGSPERGWLNMVTAAVRIFDGQSPTVNARADLSQPLILTFDNNVPAPPSAPDLLDTSDGGCEGDDNLTGVNPPAFGGTAEMNTIIRIFADGILVGEGTVGSDMTDGVLGNGLGTWEVTIEPLADGEYTITATVEDLAGNISAAAAMAGTLVIDTQVPQRPTLDLLDESDSGRNDKDNVTRETTLTFRVTAEPGSHVVIKDGNTVIDEFEMPDAPFIDRTIDFDAVLPPLGIPVEGDHLLSAEATDCAGNRGAQSEQLIVTIDLTAPAPPTIAIDPTTSDTGVTGYPATIVDRVTSDTTTGFVGTAEADAIVRLYANAVFDGLSVALPEDGNKAFPNGQWNQTGILDLNDPNHFPLDGVRTMNATAEDLAGNESELGELVIFVDTAGPQVTSVHITDNPATAANEAAFDLFDPKPLVNGPTPVVNSLSLDFRDLPNRVAAFLYDALHAGVAAQPGHYVVRGDHNGIIPITEVVVTNGAVAGSPATATVELRFSSPLPDDRYTLTIADTLVDPAGNALDGENNAREPLETPLFPSGDGQPGGGFTARFTIDTRPEIGTFALGTTYIDINGNTVWDSEGQDNDYTNRDISFVFGFRDDRIFAGNFAPAGAGAASGFDKLGGYGNAGSGSAWRWRLDFDHNGTVDYDVLSGVNTQGDPVAGNFSAAHPGDEIGLFNSGKWWLDATGNNNIGDAGDIAIQGGNMKGQPIVGDFDGDGLDDLGTWDPGNAGTQFDGVFQFDLAHNGLNGNTEKTIQFDIPGVFQKAIAADMNKDGIDDIGLFVSRREGIAPAEAGEWFFLVSTYGAGGGAAGSVNALHHPFTPAPFGNDIFAQFGDEAALPVVGNFDPPTDLASIDFPDPVSPLDVNGDGDVTPLDALLIFNELNNEGSRAMSAPMTGPGGQIWMLDTSGDKYLSALDALLIFNRLNNTGGEQPEGESAAVPSGSAEFDLLAILADDQVTARRRRG